MRVVHVVEALSPRDGRGRVAMEVAKEQCRRGHEVGFVTSCGPGMASLDVGRSLGSGPRWRVPLPRNPWSVRTALFALGAGLRARQASGWADVIHAHAPCWGPVNVATCHGLHRAALARAASEPALAEALGIRAGDLRRVRWLLPLLETQYRDAKIVALTSRAAGEFEVHLGVESSRLHVIGNGVDVETFRPAAARWAEEPAPTAGGALRLLFVGHDFRRKGLPLVLAALPDLPGVSLQVVGDDPHDAEQMERARATVRQTGLGERVEFLGSVDGLEILYRDCDALVLPSAYEGFALSVLEAMASGVAVIGSPAAIPESIRDGAWILPERPSVGDLVALLGELVGRPRAVRDRGRAARRVAEQNSWSQVVDALDRLYES